MRDPDFIQWATMSSSDEEAHPELTGRLPPQAIPQVKAPPSGPPNAALIPHRAPPPPRPLLGPEDRDLIMRSNRVTEEGYAVRRFLDMPDWATPITNMTIGFSVIAGVEIFQEELIGMLKPRFLDEHHQQVHEDGSFHWFSRSAPHYLKFPHNIKHHCSQDQDDFGIAQRIYIWSFVEGKSTDLNEDAKIPLSQVLSPPQRLLTANAEILQQTAKKTSSMSTSHTTNQEMWTPFSAESPIT